jgi:hypothetical protein
MKTETQHPNKKAKQTTVMLSPGQALALKQLAIELGYGSMSALLRAIADNDLVIGSKEEGQPKNSQ